MILPPRRGAPSPGIRPRAALAFVALVFLACRDSGADSSAASTDSSAATTTPASAALPASQEAFWASLQALCGHAFAGRLVVGVPADTAFERASLRMHVRECSPTEVRVPFHVGENRSRTWVVTRTSSGLRLKHDHRHEDGSEDAITQYGGDTRDAGSATSQEFHADSLTAALIPAARTNIWTMEIAPRERAAYALRREGTDRRFRVEFDLARPIDAPPPPWGSRP